MKRHNHSAFALAALALAAVHHPFMDRSRSLSQEPSAPEPQEPQEPQEPPGPTKHDLERLEAARLKRERKANRV